MELAGRAMSALHNQAVAGNPPSDNAIIAKAFLWAVSIFILDKQGMQEYANSMHALVRLRGGLHNLGMQGFVEQFIRFVDARHGLVAHTASEYTDAPEPPALQHTPARKYGSFWDKEQVVQASILSQDVVNACRNVCRIIELGEEFVACGATTPRYLWLLGRILHLAATRSRALEAYEGTNTINELVITANELSLTFAVENTSKQRNAILYQAVPLVKAMQEIVKQWTLLLEFQHDRTDLFLWVLFLIVMVPHEFEGRDWAFEQVCRIVRNTLARNGELPSDWTEQIFSKFTQFTWSDLKLRKPFDAICVAICEKILPHKHGT